MLSRLLNLGLACLIGFFFGFSPLISSVVSKHGLGGYLNNLYFRAVWVVRVEPFGRAFDHFAIKRAAKGNFTVTLGLNLKKVSFLAP